MRELSSLSTLNQNVKKPFLFTLNSVVCVLCFSHFDSGLVKEFWSSKYFELQCFAVLWIFFLKFEPCLHKSDLVFS